MNLELKDVKKADEKVLAKFFCETLDPPTKQSWRIHLLKFGFVRNKILKFISKAVLKHWDNLKFWLILADNDVAGFVMISWMEKDNRTATIHEIYLKPELRGRKIEKRVIELISDFCDKNKLRLGFGVKPEWELDKL